MQDRSTTAMKHPDEYPRRPLVAVTGLSPQVVTETLYALAVKPTGGARPSVPTEVHLVTTKEGAERARLALLHPESGWFHQLRAEYDLPAIGFDTSNIHMLRDPAGLPLDDIRTPEDNTAAADAITELVRDFCRDSESAIHVSIAGGRKTMGFYLGYALSLYGRQQDRLSHVLVSEPYESHPHFFYPTKASKVIDTLGPDSRPYDTKEARVTLAAIPFVRLRDELAEAPRGAARFGESVAAAQRALARPELVLDVASRRLSAGGEVISLSPVQFAFLAWLARRQQAREPWLPCPSGDVPEVGYAAAFRAELDAVIGEMGDGERTAKRLCRGMDREFFSQTKSKLHVSLRRRLGSRRAPPYLIAADGPRSQRRYGLAIEPGAIKFASVDAGGAGA